MRVGDASRAPEVLQDERTRGETLRSRFCTKLCKLMAITPLFRRRAPSSKHIPVVFGAGQSAAGGEFTRRTLLPSPNESIETLSEPEIRDVHTGSVAPMYDPRLTIGHTYAPQEIIRSRSSIHAHGRARRVSRRGAEWSVDDEHG